MKITDEMILPELRGRGKLFSNFSAHLLDRRYMGMQQIAYRLMGLQPVKGVRLEKRWVPRPDGGKMKLLILRPLSGGVNLPGVLWLHGGGYASGAAEMALTSQAQRLARSGGVVLAPEYRLSLEAPYPAALEDAYAALRYLSASAAELGVRADQLCVGGESAGGGLAAALCLYARDRGEIAIAFQMPLYPMLDDRMITASSRDNDAPVWNSALNEQAWRLYLGALSSGEVPIYAAPARATDYRGLPPAVTFVGELEPFRDETLAYIENLRIANIPAEIAIYPGCYHGFDVVCPAAEVSKQAGEFLEAAYRHAKEHYFAPQPAAR